MAALRTALESGTQTTLRAPAKQGILTFKGKKFPWSISNLLPQLPQLSFRQPYRRRKMTCKAYILTIRQMFKVRMETAKMKGKATEVTEWGMFRPCPPHFPASTRAATSSSQAALGLGLVAGSREAAPQPKNINR
jgi:hypothetical protein